MAKACEVVVLSSDDEMEDLIIDSSEEGEEEEEEEEEDEEDHIHLHNLIEEGEKQRLCRFRSLFANLSKNYLNGEDVLDPDWKPPDIKSPDKAISMDDYVYNKSFEEVNRSQAFQTKSSPCQIKKSDIQTAEEPSSGNESMSSYHENCSEKDSGLGDTYLSIPLNDEEAERDNTRSSPIITSSNVVCVNPLSNLPKKRKLFSEIGDGDQEDQTVEMSNFPEDTNVDDLVFLEDSNKDNIVNSSLSKTLLSGEKSCKQSVDCIGPKGSPDLKKKRLIVSKSHGSTKTTIKNTAMKTDSVKRSVSTTSVKDHSYSESDKRDDSLNNKGTKCYEVNPVIRDLAFRIMNPTRTKPPKLFHFSDSETDEDSS